MTTLEDTKTLSSSQLRFERWVLVGIVGVPFVGLAIAVPYFWQRGLDGIDLLLFAAMYLVSGFGVTVGYHRLFSHRSFTAGRPLRLVLAIAGSMAIEGPVIRWVADHRRHHRFSDREGDPHSPHAHGGEGLGAMLRQLGYAHLGWFFDTEKTVVRRYASDLLNDPVVRFVDRHYLIWVLLSLALPGAAGLALGGPEGAVSAVLFAGLVRIFMVQHVTWSVNSICHYFGRAPYRTHDESRNNPVMAVLALGEGWHNNHHAFPHSAVQGLDRGQLDPSAWVILGLEKLGLARRVRRVSEERKAARRHGGESSRAARST